jgi:hypothetical protein
MGEARASTAVDDMSSELLIAPIGDLGIASFSRNPISRVYMNTGDTSFRLVSHMRGSAS